MAPPATFAPSGEGDEDGDEEANTAAADAAAADAAAADAAGAALGGGGGNGVGGVEPREDARIPRVCQVVAAALAG